MSSPVPSMNEHCQQQDTETLCCLLRRRTDAGPKFGKDGRAARCRLRNVLVNFLIADKKEMGGRDGGRELGGREGA